MTGGRGVEVTHVSPTFVAEGGVWGGGDRYAYELALATAAHVPTRLVTFGPRRRRMRAGPLSVQVLPLRWLVRGHDVNPLSELLLPALLDGRVLHAHQYESLLTNIVTLAARATGRPAFVTDLGGGGANVSRLLSPLVSGMLALSEFATSFYPELANRTRVIGGGVDVERFHPDGGPRRREVVYVGRLLPHKGIDVLIEALPADVPLRVLGRTLDPAYRELLGRLSRGKEVTFVESPTDAEVLMAYRRARVAVLPSLEHSDHRPVAPKSELLGLVLLEAMACGTPVICARTGPMPEIVREGETGFVVPPKDVPALRDRIRELVDGGRRWDRLSAAGVEWVRAEHTWTRVGERCLAAYAALG